MTIRRIIEAGGDDFTVATHLHVRDFFRPFVDQQNVDSGLRIILDDAFSDGLQHHRFAGFGRRNNQGTLAFAERIEEINHAIGVVALAATRQPAFDAQLIIRMLGGEPAELRPMHSVFGWQPIYGFNFHERRTLAASWRITDFADDFITGAKAITLNQLAADEDVVFTCEVPGFSLAQEGCTIADDLEDS